MLSISSTLYCDFVYITQIKRDLKSCLAKYKLATKNQEPEKSALCEHFIQCDHLIEWNNSKVLQTEAHYSKRLVSEAWFNNSHPHVMNQSDGKSLPRKFTVINHFVSRNYSNFLLSSF